MAGFALLPGGRPVAAADKLAWLQTFGEFKGGDQGVIVELADDVGAPGPNRRDVVGEAVLELITPLTERLIGAREGVAKIAIDEAVEKFDSDAVGDAVGLCRSCEADARSDVGLEYRVGPLASTDGCGGRERSASPVRCSGGESLSLGLLGSEVVQACDGRRWGVADAEQGFAQAQT